MAITTQTGGGEFSKVSLLVQGSSILAPAIEVTVWESYSITSNLLTPSDPWRAEIGDATLTDQILGACIPGNRVKWFIDGAPQMSGYITNVDTTTDKSRGTTLVLEGFDSMWPVTDSQIDPNKHYADKTSLETLLLDLLPQFGFANFFIDNGANVELAANRALHSIKSAGKKRRHNVRTKTLKRYKLPKKKPAHNDTFWQFLMRLLNRSGLWMWPTVDGTGVIVSTPDYEQDPAFELRRSFFGDRNNVESGGIRRDCSDQPTQIIARGNVPLTAVEHQRTRVVLDNPYIVGLGLGLSLQEAQGVTQAQLQEDQARGQTLPGGARGLTSAVQLGIAKAEQDARLGRNSSNLGRLGAGSEAISESQTYVSYLERLHTEVQKWTQLIPVKPITVNNFFAPQTARPLFLKDDESHTLEELSHFAQRQMSLHARKAFIAKYKYMGHAINDVLPQPDMMFSLDDEVDGFNGQLWIVGRTFTCDRQKGQRTEVEGLMPNAVFF